MPLAKLLLGLAALAFGRQLYWLFVGVAGFVVGVELATRAFGGEAPWKTLVAALALGLVGALLAIGFQFLTLGVAGFLVGAWVALRLLPGPEVSGLGWLAVLVAGLCGVALVLLMLDGALILLSSLAGATLVTDALGPPPHLGGLLFIGLLVAGVVFQAVMLRRRPTPGPGPGPA
jgi:hypothetical protein